MRISLFVISFILVVGVSAAYMSWRLLGPARFGRGKALAVVGLIGSIVMATPLTIILRSSGIENFLVDLVSLYGYIGLAFISFVLTFLLMRDLLLLVSGLPRSVKRFLNRESSSPQPPDTERRRFLLNGLNTVILTGAGAMTGYGVAEARQIPEIKTIRIPFDHLPSDLDGFRIVQLTDIHVGSTIKRPFVEGIVAAANTLSADIVAITGDLVDGSVPRLSADVAPLSGLQAAHGKFFVTGNHEYYSGADAWVEKVRSLGFTVLLNEHRLVQHGQGRLLIAGVTDYRGGRFAPSHESNPFQAMAGAPKADLSVLLAHQPRSIFDAAKAGFDLQISGHTHGGQFFPWNYIVFLTQPYVTGLHRHAGTRIYISGGTGYWGPPVRLGSPSEITLIELIKA
ncbi:MAG: metallophosphoesterase [Thermodesulfobacteriota bacterium]